MSGCLDEFLLNGEPLPLDGATDRFHVEQVGSVSSRCGIVPPGGGGGGGGEPGWRLAVIIVGAVVGFCLVLLLILLVVFFVRRRWTRHSKGDRLFNQSIICYSAPHPTFKGASQ